MYRLVLKAKFLAVIIFSILLRVFFFFVPKKEHWVIIERGNDARDNGYFFYKYLKEHHPEKKLYYIIDSKSADYYKVMEDAVQPYTFKYYKLIFTCEKYISTHNNSIISGLYKYRKLTGIYKKYFFLQHGITMSLLPSLFFQKVPMKLFICGAKPEYEFIRDKFGHSADVVKYTGFARFDNLHDINTKRQILVMPTWRSDYGAEFEESIYYKSWNALLNSKQLIENLEKNNIDLIFYPHIEVQKHLHCFSSKSKNVIFASFNNYDVQTLLKESALLITDYSSVHFDFAYMKKPIIYFQFDRDDFYRYHYQKGYFDYDTMGFGVVCSKTDDTIEQICKSIGDSFVMNPEYLNRTQAFFAVNDNKNCERIYAEITAIR